MKRSLIGLSLTLLYGCITTDSDQKTFKNMTSGAIGCLPAEITLSEVDNDFMSSGSWLATCKGKEFVCSFVSRSEGGIQTNCKERMK